MTIENGPEDPDKGLDRDMGLLERLSPFFRVSETKYGGRGCFSTAAIPKGTVVFEAKAPLSSTILRDFRKEVCSHCFEYFGGKTLKSRIQKKNVALYFCADECKTAFLDSDKDGLLVECLLDIEENYQKGLKKPEEPLREPERGHNNENLFREITREWDQVLIWETKLAGMKPSKRANLVPRLSENEYLEVKYVVGALYRNHQRKVSPSDLGPGYLNDLPEEQKRHLELSYFDMLQSNENEKIVKYPYLLYSYINIFKFLKTTAPGVLQPYINQESIKGIIGKYLSNVFGIWSDVSDFEREDREFFGFGIFPLASFFNHSCGPNMVKSRSRNTLSFTALRDIAVDEEICINYGYSTNEKVEERRKYLEEWFFICQCDKCVTEAACK